MTRFTIRQVTTTLGCRYVDTAPELSAANPLLRQCRVSGTAVSGSDVMDASRRGRAAGAERWERLQAYLFVLRPGAVVTVGSIARRTGLDTEAIEMVLRGLTRATIFRQQGAATYVRQRIHPERP